MSVGTMSVKGRTFEPVKFVWVCVCLYPCRHDSYGGCRSSCVHTILSGEALESDTNVLG